MTKEQKEVFAKNPRFVGLKFPDLAKPETLEKRYMGKMSAKALSLMSALLKMDPKDRITGREALGHEYFNDIRDAEDEEEICALVTPPVYRPIYSSQSRMTNYGQKFV